MRKEVLALLIVLSMLLSTIPVGGLAAAVEDVDDEIMELLGDEEPEFDDFGEEFPDGELFDGEYEMPVDAEEELPVEETQTSDDQADADVDMTGEQTAGDEASDPNQGEAEKAAPEDEEKLSEDIVENDAGDTEKEKAADVNADEPDSEGEKKADGEEDKEADGEEDKETDGEEDKEADGEEDKETDGEEDKKAEAEKSDAITEITADAELEEAVEEAALAELEVEEANEAMQAEAAYEALTVSQDKATLAVGDTLALISSGGSGNITWTSDNPAVANMDANGVVTAVAVGSAKITATDGKSQTAACEITVVAAYSGAVFDVRTLAVGVGETVALSNYASIDAATFSGVSLSSADSGVASVNTNGYITAVAAGETRITATYNGQQDALILTVKPAPTAIVLPYKTLRIGKGDKVRIRANLGDGASTLTCTSSRAKIVKTAKGGFVRGVKKGTAYVTVKTFNGLSARLKVVVKDAPRRVTATPNPLNLGIGETYTLGYKTAPKGTAGSVRFKGDNPRVFAVDEHTGAITGISAGTGTVTLTTYNGKVTTCPVNVYAAPTSVAFDTSTTSVAKKKKVQLKLVFNEGAWSNITYEVENPNIAKVSATGMVTGLRVGQTVIRAKTFVPGLTAETTFTVMGPPSRVWLDQKSVGANVGEPFKLEPHIPAGSKTTFKFKSSNRRIATVNKDGVVTPKKKGKVKITITTHNKKKCTLTVKVANPGQVNAIKLDGTVPVLYVGDSWQVGYTVTPANATTNLTWTTSNAGVATVSNTGFVQAVGFGQTTIKATPAGNAKAALKFTLSVQTRALTLDIPARTTDVAGIPGNLAMIDNIRKSAISEIARLQAEGAIGAVSATRRKEIVNAIFANYAFPWMTPSKQNYWKAANSENGAKDFKPDRVYYGMPYISGSGANRHYSASRAISEGRYTDTGMGYYMLNKGAYLNGKYVGNDCSGLVNVSIWGDSGAHVADRTAEIAVVSAYKTVSFDAMLPGDLINKGSAHVVMFLYYASADKSKIMIIENGGSEKGTNTVHCSVMTASAYKNSGYKVRRLAELD